MHLMYYMNAAGRRVYTLKKEAPNGEITYSAHPGKRDDDTQVEGEEDGRGEGVGADSWCLRLCLHHLLRSSQALTTLRGQERGQKGQTLERQECIVGRRHALRLALTPNPHPPPAFPPHPTTARFSPDDKFSKQRLTLKKRFNLLPTQQGERVL